MRQPYGRLRWRRRYYGDRVIWIDMQLFEASWRHDPDYVGYGGLNGIEGRYEQFGQWLDARFPGPVWMPEVGLGDDEFVGFSDGRHRFAWLRDHGVRSLPMATSRDEIAKLTLRFGTKSRTSWLPARADCL